MKITSRLSCCLTLLLCAGSLLAQLPSTNAPRPRPALPPGAVATAAGTNAAAQPTRTRLPFQGTVKSVNSTAMILTLTGTNDQERVLHLDGESRLIKSGKPAPLAEVVAADYVRGLLRKNDRGEEVVVHGTFGPKPTPKAKGKTSARPRTTTPPVPPTPAPLANPASNLPR